MLRQTRHVSCRRQAVHQVVLLKANRIFAQLVNTLDFPDDQRLLAILLIAQTGDMFKETAKRPDDTAAMHSAFLQSLAVHSASMQDFHGTTASATTATNAALDYAPTQDTQGFPAEWSTAPEQTIPDTATSLDYLFGPQSGAPAYGAAPIEESHQGSNVGFTAFMPAFNADMDLANLGSVEWDQVRLDAPIAMQY